MVHAAWTILMVMVVGKQVMVMVIGDGIVMGSNPSPIIINK